jgi:hypothetical protein
MNRDPCLPTLLQPTASEAFTGREPVLPMSVVGRLLWQSSIAGPWEDVRQACRQLGRKLADGDVELLRSALTSSDDRFRQDVLHLLTWLGPRAAAVAPQLMEILAEPASAELRKPISRVLAGLGRTVVPVVAAGRTSPDSNVRGWVVATLVQIGIREERTLRDLWDPRNPDTHHLSQQVRTTREDILLASLRGIEEILLEMKDDVGYGVVEAAAEGLEAMVAASRQPRKLNGFNTRPVVGS